MRRQYLTWNLRRPAQGAWLLARVAFVLLAGALIANLALHARPSLAAASLPQHSFRLAAFGRVAALLPAVFEKKWGEPCHGNFTYSLFSSRAGADVAVLAKNSGRKQRDGSQDCEFDVVFYNADAQGNEMAFRRVMVKPAEETEVLSEKNMRRVQIENCRNGSIKDPQCTGTAQVSSP